MKTLPIPLASAGDEPKGDVGGKAGPLGLMLARGHRVPDGFVVPPDMDLSDLAGVGEGPFAVRSSAVGEDGAEHSMAGRFETLLDVYASDLKAAITQVRTQAAEPIPVLVQQMVEPAAAGVAFTADPITGDRSVTSIDAVASLADRLVGGRVGGERWTARDGKVERTGDDLGVLTRKMASEVAKMATDVASEMQRPVDVEWAWNGDGLWLIQARPMTAIPKEVSWDPGVEGVYHRGFRFGEWMPEPPTPLFESWMLTRMERRLHEFSRANFGQVAREPLHVMVNGWYFYSLNWLPVPGVALGRNLPRLLAKAIADPKRSSVMFPFTVRHGFDIFEAEWRNDLLPRYLSAVAAAEGAEPRASESEIVERLDELSDLVGEYFGSIAVVAGSAYKFETQLARFWRRHLADSGISHMEVLQGLFDPSTVQAPVIETLDLHKEPLRSPPRPETDLAANRVAAVSKAKAWLEESPRRQRKLTGLIADAQRLAPIREEQLALLPVAWPVMRSLTLKLGRILADAGSIGSADDVFFLRREEILRLLDGAKPMHSLVAERREERESSLSLRPPLMAGRVPYLVDAMFRATTRAFGGGPDPAALVAGVPASPGRATGPVALVRDSSDFEIVKPGDVVVAPLTTPAWGALFEDAAALVTDIGSPLAHASIIAREYGLPAVVGCGNATGLLEPGQIVTVDGSRGTVVAGP